MITFMVYVLSDESHVLTPQKAFVALALFGIMSMPMSLLPMLIVYIVEVQNHLKKYIMLSKRLWAITSLVAFLFK